MGFVSTAARMLLGLSPFEGDARRLVIVGEMRAPLVLARAQAAGVEATGFDSAAWQVFGADVPRFVAPEGRLLIEGQRTNSVRNPRFEGAVAGTPGAVPANMTLGTAGLTQTIVGTGLEFGLPYIEVRFQGTATGSQFNFFPGLAAHTPAAAGQNWTASFFARLVSGSAANINGFRATLSARNTDNSASIGFGVGTTGALTSNLATAVVTYANLPANTGFISHRMDVVFANASGDAIDATVRFYAPQLELGDFASTPILPPVGTPGASTRGTDILTAPLSALGIADNGACTVLWRGAFSATNSAGQVIAAIHNGSTTNRFLVERRSNAGSMRLLRTTAGAEGTMTVTGSPPANNDTVRLGMAIDGAGRAAVSLDGDAVVAITGGPTSGLLTFQHGNVASAAAPMWGETHTLTVLPRVLSDADLQAAVAAL
jgi:hypothetical protein